MNAMFVTQESLIDSFESLPLLTDNEITASMLAKEKGRTHWWAMKQLRIAEARGDMESHPARIVDGKNVIAFRWKEK
jgi:hypothetical protein